MDDDRRTVTVSPDEVEFTAMRAQGAGGQNVNKVSSAVHLRFDIVASSLPDDVKQRLLALRDQRIAKDGALVLKAQKFRSQEKNRAEGLRRLQRIVDGVATPPKPRKPTQPSRSARRKRVDEKTRRGQLKASRRAPPE